MSLSTDAYEYETYSVLGDRYTFLLTGAQTGGAYVVFDFLVPPGGGTPPHVHHQEDEAFYVIEGEFEFSVAGTQISVGAGGFIFGRREVPHHFKNIGSTPGRMIVTVTPAGLEDFFREIGTRLKGRDDAPILITPDDIARVATIAPRYGIEVLVGH